MNIWEKMDEHEGVKKPLETTGYTRFGPRERSIYSLPVSTSTWFCIILLLIIPFINIISLLVMAYSEGINENLKYFARALLIWSILAFIVFIIF